MYLSYPSVNTIVSRAEQPPFSEEERKLGNTEGNQQPTNESAKKRPTPAEEFQKMEKRPRNCVPVNLVYPSNVPGDRVESIQIGQWVALVSPQLVEMIVSRVWRLW